MSGKLYGRRSSSDQKTSKDSGLSSTPHAPRQRKAFPYGLAYPHPQQRQHRQYLDASKIKAWSAPDLLKAMAKENEAIEDIPQQATNVVTKTVLVKPFRRLQGHKAPEGIPRLDLSQFNEPDSQMAPIEIICTSDVPNNTTSRTDISWGTPRTVPVQQEVIKSDNNDRQSTPTTGNTSTPLSTTLVMPEYKKDYIETKLISHERSKMEPFYHSSTEKVSTTLSENERLARKIRFGARILSQNGRDVHRELCGFYFLGDRSLTIYEFRQFGQRFSALPLIPRNVYNFPKGKREGERYEIKHIRKGYTLYFETSSLSSLPESLKKRQILAVRITEVDEQMKWKLMTAGLKPNEFHKVRTYLQQKLTNESSSQMLTTLQGMLQNRLQGRASRTLVGLGRALYQLSDETGLIDKLQLQQALRTYHIGLTPEDFDQLWELLRDSYIVMNQDNIACNGRSGGRGKEGVWLERCITGLVGELKEERQLFLRKVFQKLDQSRTGNIQLSELHKYFTPSNHPDVVAGRKSTEEIVHSVVGYLQPSVNSKFDKNCISYADFEHYYIGVSLGITADHEFIHFLRRCWSL